MLTLADFISAKVRNIQTLRHFKRPNGTSVLLRFYLHEWELINTCMIVINYRFFFALSLCHIRIKIISMAVCLFYATVCACLHILRKTTPQRFTLDRTPTVMLRASPFRELSAWYCVLTSLIHFWLTSTRNHYTESLVLFCYFNCEDVPI